MKKIIIADDHPMIRGALSLAVATAFGKADILESATLGELSAQLTEIGSADLVLLDLRMPGANGFEGLMSIRTNFPATPIVVISALDDPRLVAEAMALGAAGFIPKSTPRHEIVAALHQVASGATYVPAHINADLPPRPKPCGGADVARRVASLTPQERRVLQLLGTGKLNKEIAYDLTIAETTVKAHVSSILHKLKVYSRTQAVVMTERLNVDAFGQRPEA